MKQQLFVLLCGFASIAQAELVSDKQSTIVSGNDLVVLMEKVPERAQKKLLKNKEQLKGQLEQLYLREAIAKMAVQEGLDKNGLNSERLKAIMNNALYLIKIDALGRLNNRDYSKYAKQIYLKNQSDYKVEQRIDAAHILISTKELSDAEALEKAQVIKKKLTKGEDFSELALKESDDKSVKRNKGELGMFTMDQMVKPFSDAALALNPGEVSMPVKTRFGYHIIKLNNKIDKGVKPFDEVKDSIISKLKRKDLDRAKEKLFEQVKKDNEMQIDELALDDFVVNKLEELNRAEK